MPVLRELAPAYDATIFSEGEPNVPFAEVEPMLQESDGMIATFAEPDPVLKQKVLFMHAMGKSVLVGMNPRLNPSEVLSEIAEPPYDDAEKRPKRAYYIYGEDSKSHAITVNRNGLSKLQMEIWLTSQRYLYRPPDAPELVTEPFEVILSDRSRHGAEADQLPLPED